MISVHLMTVYDTYETNKQNSCKKLDSTLCECEVILLQNATQSRLLEVFYSSRSPCSLPNRRLSKAYSVPRLGSHLSLILWSLGGSALRLDRSCKTSLDLLFKAAGVCSDTASNMTNMMSHLPGLDWNGCLNHVIQLVVNVIYLYFRP